MAGLVHPPKAWKSEKEGLLSQWAYQSCCEATLGHPVKLPMMVCHMYLEAQMAGTFPWLLILLMVSVRKLQLPLQSEPHPQPELGLVQTSIQTIPQRLLEMAAIIWSTWAEADLPLQGNMQISVISPAALALLRLLMMLGSTPPQEQYPLMMAKLYPLFFMHWQVEVEKSWLTSTPRVQRAGQTMSRSNKQSFMIISYNGEYAYRVYSAPQGASLFSVLLAFLKVLPLAPMVSLWSISFRRHRPSFLDTFSTTSMIFSDFSFCEPVPVTAPMYLRKRLTSYRVSSLSWSLMDIFPASPPLAISLWTVSCWLSVMNLFTKQLLTTLVVMPIFTFLLMWPIRFQNSDRSAWGRLLRKQLIIFSFSREPEVASRDQKNSTVLQKLACCLREQRRGRMREGRSMGVLNFYF